MKDQDGWGYYVEGFYKFWPKFMGKSTFGRDFKDPKMVLSLRYDYVNLDKLADRQMDRVTIGFSYRPTPRTAFKVDYQFNHCPNGTWPVDQAESQGLGKNSNALLFGIHVGF